MMTGIRPKHAMLAITWIGAGSLAVACGGSTHVEDDGGGGSGAGTPTGFGSDCGQFADQPGAVPVTITVDNPTTEDVWLANPTCSPSEFGFTANGQSQSLPFGICSCESQQTEPHACTFTCDGPSHTLVRIPPGASHEWVWSGQVYQRREMPQSCYADQLNEYESCQQIVPASDGAYEVSVEVHTGVTCQPGGGGECTCTPSRSGSCSIQVFGFEPAATTTISASFDVPGDASVTLAAN